MGLCSKHLIQMPIGGVRVCRAQAEIDFCGETLVSRHLERTGRSALHDKIRAATWTEDSKALDMVLRQYGREVRASRGGF